MLAWMLLTLLGMLFAYVNLARRLLIIIDGMDIAYQPTPVGDMPHALRHITHPIPPKLAR